MCMKILKSMPYHIIAVVSHGEFLNRFLQQYSDDLGISHTNFMNNCEYVKGVLYDWYQIKPHTQVYSVGIEKVTFDR